MNRLLLYVFAIVTLLLSVPNLHRFDPSALLSSSLVLSSPTSCPSSGCSSGQRLNFDTTYSIDPTTPNVQVCLYASSTSGPGTISWVDTNSLTITPYGEISNVRYTPDETDQHICTNNLPNNYVFLGGVFALLPTDATTDRLSFAFRINNSSPKIAGVIVAEIFESDANGTNWNKTGQPSLSLNINPAAITSYVANDPISCGTHTPCYVNSGDDNDGGIGTGLKDAIDAQTFPASINILGNYTIKSNSVNVNYPHRIQGENSAAITYSGSLCNNPMLLITSAVTLSQLNINSGSCLSIKRDLIAVDSLSPVIIESNTLYGGKNAVTIADNNGATLIRFNHIQGNTGYGIFRSPGPESGLVKAIANNIYGNRPGFQAECNDKGQVDHNFWGAGISVSNGVSHCTVTNGKRLGAAILHSPSLPGVDASLITVTASKTSAFNQKIAFQHSNSDSDFDLYVANHGYGSNDNIPFLGYGTTNMIPCNSFYDIFLDEIGILPNSLIASFKYDLNPNCTAIIESSDYCGQVSNPAKYPLWWYDPLSNSTNGWNTTGQNPDGTGSNGSAGQLTTCSPSTKEISVSIDSSGRPNISNDLQSLPMVVGFPASINLANFAAAASITQVTLQWNTLSETNIAGFYVTRSELLDGVYSRTSSFIPAKGNGNIGGIYTFIDTNLSFGINYFYKLEVIGTNNQTVAFYGPISARTATATPTISPTPTITSTSTVTNTNTITKTGTITPTRTRTITRTFTLPPTNTPRPTWTATIYKSHTPRPTITPTQTITSTVDPNLQITLTAGAGTVFSDTETPENLTPGPDEGYPVITSQTPGDVNPSGTQFAANETTTPQIYPSGYPVLESTQTPGDHQTSTPPGDGKKPFTISPFLGSKGILFWVLALTGTLITITLVALTGWILFKRRIL